MKNNLCKLLITLGLASAGLVAQTRVKPNPEAPLKSQPIQRAQNCLPCHQRQYDELRSSVKSGYRNVSPLFNGLETSANMINGGLLRPVYADSTKVLPDGTKLNTNMFTTPVLKQIRQVQAGFCYTCHSPNIERGGDTDPKMKEVPELAGVGPDFRPDLFRPLRDYHMVDSAGNQIIPAKIGDQPPPGAGPSLATAGISCDLCHNVAGPDMDRSFQRDGFANMSIKLNQSIEKVGPFPFPVNAKNQFHVSSNDQGKISFLRSGAFCNACHDVRLPGGGPGDLQHYEFNANAQNLLFFRLENLSTEWQIGAYNSTDNPFGKVTRCQDCHMSLFPFAGTSNYQVGSLNITSATPGVFAQNYAAVPGISTDQGYPLPKRAVVDHHFTGTDVPLLSATELRNRLGADYPDPYETGVDEYGIPKSLAARRQKLLENAARIDVSKTDPQAVLGHEMVVRLDAVGLSGHRYPAGFSQERTAYVQLNVTDDNGFVLYQSGYVVDKPHPDTGELKPDGSLDDEDNEHIHAVVDGGHAVPVGTYTPGPANNGSKNLVFELGPDNGPDDRVYSGVESGLVLFRNELTVIYLPGQSLGRNDADGKPMIALTPHYEETFNAATANTVDNYRSLQPLVPRQFRYKFTLPTQEELDEMGVTLKAPLHIQAIVHDEHFPPVFVRYLARTTGPDGPGGDKQLVTEQTIDTFLKTNKNLAASSTTVSLAGAK
ncbi:MAG: eukaryotic-like serine/threonine-protein kinase [Bryobacterales bacterium]|jgi:hypothetical protein|nr:eukaryotic-like serine/threonine-protein kinase [Bryobacterales bacterium]